MSSQSTCDSPGAASGAVGPRVVLRPMVRADAARVGALTVAAYDGYGRIHGPYRDFLADPLLRADGATEIVVAELSGELVGTVTYVVPGDTEWEGRADREGDCGFRVLAVAPHAEGAGVGRALVAHCIDRARREGRHRMSIVSMAWMARAHAMYGRFGFDRRPDLDVRFPGGDGVAFTLDLTAEAPSRFPPPGPVPDTPPWFEDVWDL